MPISTMCGGCGQNQQLRVSGAFWSHTDPKTGEPCTGGKDVDTTNDQLVGSQGDHITVTLPRPIMTKEQALRHAAWLVMLATQGELSTFDEVLEAIRST